MPSEASIKQYESRLRILDGAGFTDFTKQVNDVIAYLENLNTVSNRKLYASAIMYSYGENTPPSAYKKYITKQFEEQTKKDEEQKLSEKQDEKYLSWDKIVEVQKKLADMEDKNKKEWQEYLVVSLYTLINPVRIDYGEMKVVRETTGEGNEFVMDTKPHFIFREYKTSKTYGEVKIPVSQDLLDVINGWFKALSKKRVPKYLLGKKYTRQTLSNYLRRTFEKYANKPVGINLIRHAFITNELSTPKTIQQKQAIAESMLHSRDRQEKYVVFKD